MSVVTITRDNKYIATDVYQWDKNRMLEIYGLNLDSIPEIHFYNGSTPYALVKQASISDNGVISVEMPNSILEVAKPIDVYICIYNGEEFISKYHFKLNVRGRAKPADYIETDEEKIYSYNALENKVNNALVDLEALFTLFSEGMESEYEGFKKEVNQTLANANADTLDNFHAEDFEFCSKPGTTVFNSDGSITTTYNDGSSETIVKNADGSFTTTRNTLELGIKTETIKINADGSISVTVG